VGIDAARGRGGCHDDGVSPSLVHATLRLAGLAAVAAAWLGAAPTHAEEGQEVRLHLALSSRPYGTETERDRIRELEESFLGLLGAKDAGELTRDRWEGGVCVITIAARDARLAWGAIEAAVRSFGPLPGSFAVIRAGPKGTPEERVPLGPATPPT